MKKRQFFILSLIVLLLSNSIIAFANGLIFTDIKDHWAKEFIEDIYNRKITVGYTDATFRPSNSITSLETSVMIANMLKFTTDSSLLLKYDSVIKQNNIPAWAQGHIAYLLDKGILYESEVKTFVTNGTGINAKRFEMANYIGRVLVILGNKTLSRSYYIPYKDELQIPNDSKPYLDLLLTLGILNKDSNDGQFLPNSNITRAETAKLLALTAKILDTATSVTPPVNNISTNVNGVINNIVIANRTILTIYGEDNNVNIYDVKDNALVTLDNKNSTVASLEKGQTVRLKVVNGVVEEINATGNKQVIEGHFQRVFANEGNTILTVKDLKGEFKYYTVTDTTKVYLDNKLNEFKNIKVGDYLKVTVNGSFVYEVEVKSKTKTIKGVISSKGTVSERRLEVTPKDEAPIMLTLENATIIKRDSRVVTFNDLKLGDEVTIELEYEVVKNVTASSVRRTLQGTIKKIVNDATNKTITVETKGLDLEEFVISDSVIIFVDNVVGDFYDLRLNYTVLLNIDGNEITSIITSKKVEPETVIGKVKSINREINVMTVTVDQNGTSKEMQVHVKTNTTFIGKTGGSWHFSLVKEGDQLLLTGTVTNGAFILEKVIVIN